MKFYGQFEHQVDRFIFERYFPDTNIRGTFVECGAFDGQTECSCKFFEETMGWTAYNLEPVPWIFERLQANRPRSNNFNLGLSDKSGTASFQSVIHPRYGRQTTIGAIDHSPELKAALEADGCTFEPVDIQVLCWSDFIAKTGLKEIDLMVLDVEGHELAVLSGMQNSPVLPKVMCVEFGHAGFDDIRAVMNAMGYEYDTNSHANAFFIRREALAAITLRHLAKPAPSTAAEDAALIENLTQRLADSERETSNLSARVEFLQKRETELVDLYNSMIGSKAWKLARFFRRCVGR